MKTKILFAVAVIVMFCSFNKTIKPEFLFLNQSQLKPLGIELNENGLYYKNLNPNWQQDKELYAGLGFYSCKDKYLSTIHFKESETLKPTNKYDKLMINKETTRNDFYPLLIGNTRGDFSLDSEVLPKDMKFLPVAICMSETKIKGRNDTIVVWFKPAGSLQKALPSNVKIEDFLRVKMAKK
jgi:hypothetical protein